jgi:hypothetical protein
MESTPQRTSKPQSLVRRRWPTLAGLGFAALIAVDLVSGVELAPILAASAAVYLGAAALQRPAAAWPLFFATAVVITVARLADDRFEPTWVILASAAALLIYGLLRGAGHPGYGLPLQTVALLGFGAAAAAAAALMMTPELGATSWRPASSDTPPGMSTTTASTGSSSAHWPSSASPWTPHWPRRS